MAENNTDVITDPEEAANAARINTQCFLIENMDRIRSATTPLPNLILADQEIAASDVVGLLNRGNEAEIFLTATPAQLAYLVPKIQLYIPRDEEDGKDELIYFGDYYLSPSTANTGAKPIEYDPNFLETATNVIFKESGRGRGAGISSFSYALDNKHPGSISFMASLEIKFASLRDLAEGPYVSLISPTARKLASKNSADSELELLKQERRQLAERQRNRFTKGKKPKTARGMLSSGASKLKAIIGWQTPSFKDESLIPNGDKKFYESVKANEIALLLHLTKYKLTFGEAGEATLSIDYAASIEADFSGPGSSVFPDESASDFRVAVRTKELQGLQDVTITKDGAGIIKKFGPGSTISRRLIGENGSAISLEQEDKEPTWLLDGFSTPNKVLKVPNSISLDMQAVRDDLQGFELDIKIEQIGQNRPERIELIQGYINNTKQAMTLVADRTRATKYRSFIDKLTGETQEQTRIRMLSIENRFLGKEAEGQVLPPGAVRNRRMGKAPIFYEPDARTKSLSAIGAVINSEKGAKRNETIKKIRVGRKLNPAARTDKDVSPSEAGQTRIGFMRLGDIIDIALDNIQDYTNNENIKQKIFLGTVAIPVTKKLVPEKWRYVNIADIPISVEAFQIFFLDRVISPQKIVYPLKLFISDLLKYLVEPAFNQCKLSPEDGGISFESTIITTPVNLRKGTILRSGSPLFENLADRGWNTLIEANQAQEYLVVYSEDKKSGPGDPRKDKEKGVYHLVLGSDRGLVKSISFSSNDNPHLQTQNIVNAAGGGSQLGVLAMPQDASVTMVGNNLFKTGQSVYINAEYALGRERARELLLGGYYIVTKVSNTISASGFQTTLDCRWTNFPISKKVGER